MLMKEVISTGQDIRRDQKIGFIIKHKKIN